MGHPLRWFVPGVVYEITTRTIQERYLLLPSTGVRELVLGVLARGALLYPGVHLHGFAYLSNHCHLLASADDGAHLAHYIGYVNSNVARELGRIHQWRGPFWGRRHRPIPVIDDDAVVGRLRYLLAQSVKEGLVERPEHWPGATSTAWLLGQTLVGTWIHRDDQRRARRRGNDADPSEYTKRYELELSPIPCWRGFSRDEIACRVRAMIDDIVAEARGTREHPVLGVRGVLAQKPHDAPLEPASSPAPACHASSVIARETFRAAYRAFTNAFRSAARALRLGLSASRESFPPGCFPSPRSFVPCPAQAPPPWQIEPFTPSG